MSGKMGFALGVAVGYLISTKQGREQLDKVKVWAGDVWRDPRVQSYVKDVETQATSFAKEQGTALKDKAFDAARSAMGGTPKDTAPSWTTTAPIVDADDANPGATGRS